MCVVAWSLVCVVAWLRRAPRASTGGSVPSHSSLPCLVAPRPSSLAPRASTGGFASLFWATSVTVTSVKPVIAQAASRRAPRPTQAVEPCLSPSSRQPSRAHPSSLQPSRAHASSLRPSRAHASSLQPSRAHASCGRPEEALCFPTPPTFVSAFESKTTLKRRPCTFA